MAEDVWTIRRILGWIEEYLGKHGDANPRLSAQWLVSEALGVSRMQLFMDMDRPLTAEERAVLRDYTRRRAAGEPLQYITGNVDFRHIQLKVRKGVLIPRPETEVLVSEALAFLPTAPKPQDAYEEALLRALAADMPDSDDSAEEPDDTEEPQEAEGMPMPAAGRSCDETRYLMVADICTGSGCVACSIAYEHPLTQVIATDIAPEAVLLARENSADLGLDGRVEVLECDLGDGIASHLLGSFDLVVSNPPYVPSAVMSVLPEEVSDFEPALALDGGPDGLDVFRRLLAWSASALKDGGALAVELHETCLEKAADLARAEGFEDVRIVRDLADRPRVLTARKRLPDRG